MRPSRRDPLPAADDGSSAARLPRGIAAPSDRSGGIPGARFGGMKSPLAEAERDRLIEAMLPDIAFEGWTRAAVHAGARTAGLRLAEALALFPGGAADLVGCLSR